MGFLIGFLVEYNGVLDRVPTGGVFFTGFLVVERGVPARVHSRGVLDRASSGGQ